MPAFHSLKFWVNAFIPGEIEGYSVRRPGSSGETMIIGPPEPAVNTLGGLAGTGMAATLRRYGYHTDQRSFSDDPGASSRAHSEFKIVWDDNTRFPYGPKGYNACGKTIKFDTETGAEVSSGTARPDYMSFRVEWDRGDDLSVVLSGATGNPLVTGADWVAPINYWGQFTVQRGLASLTAKIFIDEFPAFEAYASINDGRPAMIFQAPPPKGNTVQSLIGRAGRQGYGRRFDVTLMDYDGDGYFEYRR